MARRNNRSGKGRGQARRRADGSTVKRIAPPPLEQMVLPRGRCFFGSRNGKLRFAKEDAPKALKQAQANRARHGSGAMEKRFYACPEGGCGDYHLTSRETFTPRSTT